MFSEYFRTLKVVDLTGEIGPYTSKLFSGYGADVIHVEPLEGNALRQVPPFFQGRQEENSSLPFLYYNAGKRGLALDLEQPAGRDIFLCLCASSDLLIDGAKPGYLESQGIGFKKLASINPKLVHTAVTPYGSDGARSGLPASDLTCAAMSGFLNLAGVDGEKSVRTPDNQAYRMADAFAAVGSAMALFHAQRTGEGQYVDVSCLEASAMALENAAQFWDLEGKVRRGRGREAGSATLHCCADGYIALVAIMGANKSMWVPFVTWMREEQVPGWEAFDNDCWIDYSYRVSEQGYRRFCEIFEAYTLRHDKAYLYQVGQGYGVAVTPVSYGQDLIENPQLKHRHFWHTEFNETLGANITYPGTPLEFGEMQWSFAGNAPRRGQHTVEILRELGLSSQQVDELIKAGVVYAECL